MQGARGQVYADAVITRSTRHAHVSLAALLALLALSIPIFFGYQYPFPVVGLLTVAGGLAVYHAILSFRSRREPPSTFP